MKSDTDTQSVATSRRTKSRSSVTGPVEVAKFWRNRRGEAVIVQLREYEGRALVDCRVHFTNKDGLLQPTGKGIALRLAKLPDLAKAIQKAVDVARERGLLDDDHGGAP